MWFARRFWRAPVNRGSRQLRRRVEMKRFVLGAVALLLAARWTVTAPRRRSSLRPPLHRQSAAQRLQLGRPLSRRQSRLRMGHGRQQPDQAVRLRRRRAGRLQLADRPLGVRCRGRHRGDRRRRHVRAVEILQPVVRHRARPGRLRLQQHPVLRHRRVSPSANCAARPSGCRNPTPPRAGPWVSAPNSAWRQTGAPRSNISMSISPTANSPLQGCQTAIGSA